LPGHDEPEKRRRSDYNALVHGPCFVTFEGVEGCGKSSQVDLLAATLRRGGIAVVTTREPGGTPLGEALRHLLLDPGHTPTAVAELLMLEAARAQLVASVVAPALDAGSWVLSDRFADSSLAYQGHARGLGMEIVARLNALACAGVRPHRTVVLDLPVGDALARARGRSSTTDDNRRFENEDLTFHDAVAAGYRAVAANEPDRVVVVDGRGSVEKVHRRVLVALRDLMP
jgi:dTMP kinase